jgi:hypothetical protein
MQERCPYVILGEPEIQGKPGWFRCQALIDLMKRQYPDKTGEEYGLMGMGLRLTGKGRHPFLGKECNCDFRYITPGELQEFREGKKSEEQIKRMAAARKAASLSQ